KGIYRLTFPVIGRRDVIQGKLIFPEVNFTDSTTKGGQPHKAGPVFENATDFVISPFGAGCISEIEKVKLPVFCSADYTEAKGGSYPYTAVKVFVDIVNNIARKSVRFSC